MASIPFAAGKDFIRTSGGKSQLLKYCLLRLAYHGNDKKIADILFQYPNNEVISSAKATLWQVELPSSSKNWDSRGIGPKAPPGMLLAILRINYNNFLHWFQNAYGTPAWAADFITAEFQDIFSPDSKNLEDEVSPELLQGSVHPK